MKDERLTTPDWTPRVFSLDVGEEYALYPSQFFGLVDILASLIAQGKASARVDYNRSGRHVDRTFDAVVYRVTVSESVDMRFPEWYDPGLLTTDMLGSILRMKNKPIG